MLIIRLNGRLGPRAPIKGSILCSSNLDLHSPRGVATILEAL
jgi:hypothetical protein